MFFKEKQSKKKRLILRMGFCLVIEKLITETS